MKSFLGHFTTFMTVLGLLGHANGAIRSYQFASVKLFPDISGRGITAHIDTKSQHFDVYFEPHSDLFTKDFHIDDGTSTFLKPDVTMLLGKVAGKLTSYAIGSVAERRFEGILFLNGSAEAFYIEDGNHLAEIACEQDPFYSSNHPQYCTVAFFGSEEDSGPISDEDVDDGKIRSKRSSGHDDEHKHGMCGWNNPKIAASLNDWMPPPEPDNTPKIRKRRTPDTKPKVCTLYIQIDTTVWSLYMSDFNNNAQTARTAITRLVGDLVMGVNSIYKPQSFYTDDGTVDVMSGFVFQVNRIRIYKKEDVCASTDSTVKQLCNDYIDSDAFLKINSEMNHDASCLAYIISHREWSGAVMGLAWLGYPRGYVGGVCQKQTRVSGGKKASYNTGIITGNNQGSRVSKRSLMLTFAHEIGHNFGSPHDKGDECVPAGFSGYYIMYPYVNPGNRENNDKFSPCSRNKIALNLDTILCGRKNNCFTDKAAPFCGNLVIEEKETCDCGIDAEECKEFGDKCCYPGNAGANACKLISPAKCSPSQGPCCNADTCKFAEKSDGIICQVSTECAQESKCDGNTATCPAAQPKENFTRCASNTRRCVNGECSESICKEIGYESCQDEMVKGVDSAQYCYLSCRPPGNNKACISSLNVGSDKKMQELLQLINDGQPLSLPPGSPCDEFRGVCDHLRRCRKVNVKGPLARIFSVLTGTDEITTAGQWLVHYWWVVAICCAIFIALAFCLLKYCSDLLPTSNPKLESSVTAKRALQNLAGPTVRRRHYSRVSTRDPHA